VTDPDTQVADFNSAVTSRIDRFVKTMEFGNNTAERYRQIVVDHQPDGGRWNGPCIGPHAQNAAWPCREVRRLNKPDTYPTSVQAAARWLDVLQSMREMVAATIPQAIDKIEYDLRIGSPNAQYNRRFAFSAFTMPFTYALAATPPRPGGEVEAAIAALKEAVELVITDPDVRGAMSRLEETMASADDALNSLLDDPEPATVTELVEELKRSLKVSMLSALLGSSGIVELADAEFNARLEELKYPPPQARWVELASVPVSVVGKPSDTTISIEEVYQSAAPGVQGLLQAMRGEARPPRSTEVQRIQGSQWISFIFAEWNDHYRFELAKVWDCGHRDYQFPLLGELGKIRNDMIHNGGIAKRGTANCQMLRWFNEGQRMHLTAPMYVEVVRLWPWDELLCKPPPSQDSRNPFPGRVPLTLIDAVQRAAAVDGTRPDDVIEQALQLWLQRDG
jgi:hypothetical protein